MAGVLDDALASPSAPDARWRTALQQVLDDPALLTLHAQPLVELTSGQIAGYELLSRFGGAWIASPDRWFAAAEWWGCNAQLQSRVLRAGIASRAALPPDTFLTVNVDPQLLHLPEIAAVLTGASDLSRLVLELTEHARPVDAVAATAVVNHVRAAGGLIAMDDAGTGYAGLSRLLSLRPDIIKLDRELISGLDHQPAKRALIEVFGDLASRMDAWILAEGIETAAELDSLISPGLLLGQGFLLARPSAVMISSLTPELVSHIRATATRTSLRTHIASLVRPVSVGVDPASNDVLLDETGRASRVRVRESAPGAADWWTPAMTVAVSAGLAEVAHRAMGRAAAGRFAPVVCTDGRGVVIGIVYIDDLITALSASTQTQSSRQDRQDVRHQLTNGRTDEELPVWRRLTRVHSHLCRPRGRHPGAGSDPCARGSSGGRRIRRTGRTRARSNGAHLGDR